MKLIQKFLFVFLGISLFVLSLGGVWTYYSFSKVIDQETDNELRGQVHQLRKLIEKGVSIEALNDNKEINIETINDTINISTQWSYSDTTAYHKGSMANIPYRKIKLNRKINQQWYHIEVHNSLLEPDDTLYGTFMSIAMISVILVVISLLFGLVISNWLLMPFHLSLAEIQNFSIQKGKAIQLPDSSTVEFKKLNTFIVEMTDRAIRDYNNLREFSENAAHEIRTPLAIASGKLDLLLQSNQLSEGQLTLITDAQKSIKGLSKVQHALNLLSRLENEEKIHIQDVNLSLLLHRITNDHSEITNLKGLTFDIKLDANVMIKADESLLEILLSNLIQNAIRHNIEHGKINVLLISNQLKVSNTGAPLLSDPSEMFKRFKRNDSKNNDSLGLGLSIVKKISQISGFSIDYSYEKESNIHTLTLHF